MTSLDGKNQFSMEHGRAFAKTRPKPGKSKPSISITLGRAFIRLPTYLPTYLPSVTIHDESSLIRCKLVSALKYQLLLLPWMILGAQVALWRNQRRSRHRWRFYSNVTQLNVRVFNVQTLLKTYFEAWVIILCKFLAKSTSSIFSWIVCAKSYTLDLKYVIVCPAKHLAEHLRSEEVDYIHLWDNFQLIPFAEL